jgi:hypothetical protein
MLEESDFPILLHITPRFRVVGFWTLVGFCSCTLYFFSSLSLPALTAERLAAKVGRLQRELRELNTTLVHTHGIHCDVVLRESGKIADPSRIPEWDALIEREKKKQERNCKSSQL